MCHNDNSAPLSVHYLNAQLKALWDNAVECSKYGSRSTINMRSDDYEKHKYARALAEFHVAGKQRLRPDMSKNELYLNASFAAPRLEFICDHEVVLYLTLKEGHLNKHFNKVKEYNSKVNPAFNHSFQNLEVAFRMKVDREAIKGVGNSKIGNNALISFVILDFSTAKMILIRPDLRHDIRDALEFYMRQYLTFLHGAGHHTLFNLPDFDDDKHSLKFDYSLMTRAFDVEELCADVTVHGTSVSTINQHLESRWLYFNSLISGKWAPADRLSTCLVALKSSWLSYVPKKHFDLEFAPPKVRALCPHEVVIYFKVDELSFYEGDQSSTCKTYHDWDDQPKWEFAFIVTVVEEKEADGCVKNLKLDLRTARFARHLSIFDCHDEIAIEYFEILVEFFSTEYKELLIIYDVYSIYYADTRIPGRHGIPSDSDSDGDGGEWSVIKHSEGHTHEVDITVVWHKTVEHLTLCGYDQVVAISEESINALFKSWWIHAKDRNGDCLHSWTYGDESRLTVREFRQVRVQLLSGNKVAVFFNIDSGYQMIDGDSTEYDCDGWTVAFVMDIKMVEHKELIHDHWVRPYGGSAVGQHHHHERRVRHIVLDFENAEFSFELSSLEGILEHGSYAAKRRLEAVRLHMAFYLKQLVKNGHNVIHSVPIFTHESDYGFTDVTFQVVSSTTVTVHNCNIRHEAPVLLVLGVCGFRPLPHILVPWCGGWVIPSRRQYISYGTLCLSRHTFLEHRLLRVLETINAQTTIVPRFPNQGENEYRPYLVTWNHHPFRHQKPCKWVAVANKTPNWLEFVWNHRDEWSYEHEMSGEQNEISDYSVLCHTRNQLLIPTTYRPGCLEITMRGDSVLRLKGKSEYNSWSKKTHAQWEAVIRVHTEGHGLRVEMTQHIEPTFGTPEFEGKYPFMDADDLHMPQLSKLIDFATVLEGIKDVLEGQWSYTFPGGSSYTLASPMFNCHGDLIVQLRAHNQYTKTIAPATKVPPTLTLNVPAPTLPPRSPLLLTPAIKMAGEKPTKKDDHSKASSSSGTQSPQVKTPQASQATPVADKKPEKKDDHSNEGLVTRINHFLGGKHKHLDDSSSSGGESPPLKTPHLPQTSPSTTAKAPTHNENETPDPFESF